MGVKKIFFYIHELVLFVKIKQNLIKILCNLYISAIFV